MIRDWDLHIENVDYMNRRIVSIQWFGKFLKPSHVGLVNNLALVHISSIQEK